MKKLCFASLGMLIIFSSHVYAQSASDKPAAAQGTPIEGGAIIMPPVHTPGSTVQEPEERRSEPAARRNGEPPHHQGVSPDKAAKHGQHHTEPGPIQSLEDNCKGRKELCKQDSAR
jgi:hypothetical protein